MTVEFLLQQALAEITAQGEDRTGLDTKTGVVLGFALISLAQTVSALFTMPIEKIHLTAHPHILALLFLMGVAAVLIVTIFGLLSLRPTRFNSFSVADDLAKPSSPPNQMSLEILDILKDAIPENDKSFSKKAKLSEYTVIFVAIAVICYAGVASLIFVPILK